MNAAELGLAVSVFLACAVEAVEALTIVMAVGYTRSWPSALSGAAAAVAVLGVSIALLGAAITALPVDALRAIVGVLLLLFGAQWLRKAVLRAAHLKSLHDERKAYERERAAAHEAAAAAGDWDGYSFAVAFKGVLLEGLEVALIVVTFGAGSVAGDPSRHHFVLAAGAAGAAVLLVIAAGAAVRGPLSRVPENTMKFAVGVMLSSFGIFWSAEGAGISWPGGDAILLAIVPLVLGASIATVFALRRGAPR
jgi:uncharacterized membrane protein